MKSLFFICLLLVLYGMAASLVRKYNYVPQSMQWTSAQAYCRKRFGDLASITTLKENQRAVNAIGQDNSAWIGLTRTTPYVNDWTWSDGDEVNFTKWDSSKPNGQGPGGNCASISAYGWVDNDCYGAWPFICCWRFTLVKEKKTWDEALKYCRSQYSGLAFVESEALVTLLKTETEQAETASVWTGLRFLDGKWFWVNRVPLGSLVSLPSCPVQPYRCGAYNFNTSVWENLDCNEELNFLCYH